ncbi:MAG: YHS domain-containing protein [Pseudomonadota bacterium]
MIGPARELGLAMLIADLSGYTALTESHGALKASEIVLRFVRLVEQSLEPGVRIVNSIGDEVFCTGASTLGVVRSALRIHAAVMRERDFPRVRIGVHGGPVVEREGRLFGAPINLTARLAGEAQGGQILCTEAIAQAARPLAAVEARPIGARRFRNVAHPVEVFELMRAEDRRASASIDPVCRMQVRIPRAAEEAVYAGKTYRFCSSECARAFAAAPELYVA